MESVTENGVILDYFKSMNYTISLIKNRFGIEIKDIDVLWAISHNHIQRKYIGKALFININDAIAYFNTKNNIYVPMGEKIKETAKKLYDCWDDKPDGDVFSDNDEIPKEEEYENFEFNKTCKK